MGSWSSGRIEESKSTLGPVKTGNWFSEPIPGNEKHGSLGGHLGLVMHVTYTAVLDSTFDVI